MMSLSHCREHRLHCRVLLVVAVVLASTLPLVLAFTTTVPHPSYSSLLGQRRKNSISSSSYHPRQFTFTTAFLAKKNDDEDEDEEAAGGSQTGMDAAFRQLSALDSLFDNGDDKSQKKSKVQLDQDAKAALSDTERASIEEEAKLFRSMLEDSEQDEGVLYSDVLKDMGGTPKEGGTTVPSPKEKKEPSVIVQDIIRGNVLDGKLPEIPDSLEDKEKFMNQAIQEALEEARNMTPENRKSLSDSILDDEEIMKEIEEIFEKGNEKLLASLEEIRQEQVSSYRSQPDSRSFMLFAFCLPFVCFQMVVFVCDLI